ncbi:MAG: indolepyruvate oxidoreductase subunit beta [Clostridia bacterium]|nr:indolepyruvate oxidoreductase subunit beta [Clostridia bacterium]
MTDILITGVGGQGIVLASKLIARAAIDAGQHVRTSETIGMSQRGGCVVSHVRVGGVQSPMIPLGNADVIIGFEPAEAVRCLSYLKEGGAVIVAKKGVIPVTSSLGGGKYDPDEMIEYLKKNVDRLIVVDGDAICEQCGSAKVLNVALLGAAAAAGLPGISPDALEQAVASMVPAKFLEINKMAFALGMNTCK